MKTDKTWYIGVFLNVKTGDVRAVSSEHFETIDELADACKENEVYTKIDYAPEGQ